MNGEYIHIIFRVGERMSVQLEKKTPLHLSLITRAICSFTLAMAVFVVWLQPIAVPDLFMAFAGGRDVFGGLLGKPDQWSFSTGNSIWINQNWGADALYFLFYKIFGYNGASILKLILIALCAMFSVLVCRKRKANLSISMITTATVLSISIMFFDNRPNLFTFAFIPLLIWLLYSSKEKPVYLWSAVLLVGVWSNIHGGFILGLGILFLWSAVLLFELFKLKQLRFDRKAAGVIFAPVIAAVLAAFANPFGLINILKPFEMLVNKSFQDVDEWRPIWKLSTYISIPVFFICIALPLVLFLLKHIIEHNKSRDNKSSISGSSVFELILTIVLILMAITSQRFFPVFMLAALPVICNNLFWLIDQLRKKWIIIILSLAVIAASTIQLQHFIGDYKNDDPLTENGNFFKKSNMVFNNNFPVNLCNFINDNKISGNAFCLWKWESYLRWNCPQVKVFIGGRAQLVYNRETLDLFNNVINFKIPVNILDDKNISMILGSLQDDSFARIADEIVSKSRWIIVYNDGTNYIAVNPKHQLSGDIVKRAKDNTLVFRDEIISNISRSHYILSVRDTSRYAEAVNSLMQTCEIIPTDWCYGIISAFFKANPKDQHLLAYFENELTRLEGLSINHEMGINKLICMETVIWALKDYYTSNNLPDKANELDNKLNKATLLFQSVIRSRSGFE